MFPVIQSYNKCNERPKFNRDNLQKTVILARNVKHNHAWFLDSKKYNELEENQLHFNDGSLEYSGICPNNFGKTNCDVL